jgi:Zn-dependent protease with chaperone function
MMEAASRQSQKPPEFLSAHPSAATRIKAIEGWMPETMSCSRPR